MALISNGVGRGTSMINPAMMATAGMLPGFGGPGVPPEMGMMMAGNMGMTPDMAALMMGGVMSNAMGGGVFPGSMGGVVVPPGFGGAGGMMLAENAEGIGGMRMGGPPAGLPFPGGVPRPPPPRGGPPGFGGPMRGRGGGWREDGGYGGGRYGRPRSRYDGVCEHILYMYILHCQSPPPAVTTITTIYYHHHQVPPPPAGAPSQPP